MNKNQCEICSHEARNPAELKQHIMAIHEGVTHSCDHCEFSTTHPSSLKRHKQTVHPYVDLKYACDDCAKTEMEVNKLKFLFVRKSIFVSLRFRLKAAMSVVDSVFAILKTKKQDICLLFFPERRFREFHLKFNQQYIV